MSWRPLIQISREHDNSIWVSSSQPDSSPPNPGPVTNRDAKTREIKIQTLKDVLFLHSPWERWMGHEPRLDNVKAFLLIL